MLQFLCWQVSLNSFMFHILCVTLCYSAISKKALHYFLSVEDKVNFSGITRLYKNIKMQSLYPCFFNLIVICMSL